MKKIIWPFEVKKNAEQFTAEDRSTLAFLENAFSEGYESYCLDSGLLFGATARNGRVAEIVRRGGRGRYWQLDLSEKDTIVKKVFVDGFEPAATAALSWLRGDDSLTALQKIGSAIVDRPGERGW